MKNTTNYILIATLTLVATFIVAHFNDIEISIIKFFEL